MPARERKIAIAFGAVPTSTHVVAGPVLSVRTQVRIGASRPSDVSVAPTVAKPSPRSLPISSATSGRGASIRPVATPDSDARISAIFPRRVVRRQTINRTITMAIDAAVTTSGKNVPIVSG